MKKLLSILMLVVIMVSVVGCSTSKNEKEVLKTLDNFEEACQNLNVDGILNCLNPTYSYPIYAAREFFGDLMDDNTDKLLRKASEWLFNQDETDPNEFLSAISFENPEVSIEGTSAMVKADLSARITDREMSYKVEIEMKYDEEEDLWFISGIDFVK